MTQRVRVATEVAPGPRVLARRCRLASAAADPGLRWATARHLQRVAGVDEAGRGPLAGPVYAAAVILDSAQPIAGLDDSKRLTPRQRERLAPQIRSRAVAWGIGSADVEEIDRLNILGATKLAMQRAIAALAGGCDGLLIDGNQSLPLVLPQLTLVGGDGLSAPIAAASILAKTERDAHMLDLDRRYPDYGFARHKGYGTAAHLAALRRLGPTPLHRRSFEPVRSLLAARAGEAVTP